MFVAFINCFNSNIFFFLLSLICCLLLIIFLSNSLYIIIYFISNFFIVFIISFIYSHFPLQIRKPRDRGGEETLAFSVEIT